MQHKRFLFLLFFSFFFLSSCIPYEESPEESVLSADPSADLTLPGKCVKSNSQVFISSDRQYCFAYPYGFYIDNIPTEEGLIVLHEAPASELPHNVEEFLAEAQVGDTILPLPITLTVYAQTIETEGYTVDLFIQKRIEEIDAQEMYRMPLDLQDKKTTLVSTESDIDNLLHVFFRHDNHYYHISFMPSFINVNDNVEEEHLVKLFFTIVETFIFIP